MIAIDQDHRLFYEGTGYYGHAVWPSPAISLATVIRTDTDWANLPKGDDLGPAKLVFREDSFDPVTRIRRGRFYVNPGTQPQDWHVQQHPAFMDEIGARDRQGFLMKRLYGFSPWPVFHQLKGVEQKVLVALGISDTHTLWRIVGIERVSTREDLVTLRARTALGVLPEINESALPEGSRQKIIETVTKLVDTAYRARPESVIDRCRDAIQAALGAWMANEFREEKWRIEDLGKLIEKLNQPKDKKRAALSSAATIVGRLHSRAKPNEQIRYDARIPTEKDAECAIELVGLVMRELGWSIE